MSFDGYDELVEALKAVYSAEYLTPAGDRPPREGVLTDPEPTDPALWSMVADEFRIFWPSWGDAQRLLGRIPSDALSDLTALTGKPWDLLTRRVLDSLAKHILFTRPWFDPRAREEPEPAEVTAERLQKLRDVHRTFIHWRRLDGERLLVWPPLPKWIVGALPVMPTFIQQLLAGLFPTEHSLDYALRGWPSQHRKLKRLITDLQSIRGRRYGAQPEPDAQPAGAGPIPDVLRERAEEALLRALGFQFNRHVRESSVALQGALAAEGEATVQAAWQSLTQALPREGGPASLDELQERWATAGRDVAGIDWATAHLRGVATAMQAAGDGQDAAQPQEPTRRKSAGRGEGETKLAAALLAWHQWDEGSIGNHTPAKIPDLMRLAGVEKGTVSGFIGRYFGGFIQYRARCRDTAALAAVLWKIDGSGPDRFSGGGDALDHLADPDAVDHNAPED